MDSPQPRLSFLRALTVFFFSPVDENDLIGLAKGVGPDLLKIAPAALAAAPAALPLLAGALGVPGEALYLAALGSFGAGELRVYLGLWEAGPPDQRCGLTWRFRSGRTSQSWSTLPPRLLCVRWTRCGPLLRQNESLLLF